MSGPSDTSSPTTKWNTPSPGDQVMVIFGNEGDTIQEMLQSIVAKLNELCGKKGEETTVTLQQVFEEVGEGQFWNGDGKGWVLRGGTGRGNKKGIAQLRQVS